MTNQPQTPELPPMEIQETDLKLALLANEVCTLEERSEPIAEEYPEYHCRERQLRDALARLAASEQRVAELTRERNKHIDLQGDYKAAMNNWKRRAESAERERDAAVERGKRMRDALEPFGKTDASQSGGGASYVGWIGVPVQQVHQWLDAIRIALAPPPADQEAV